MFATPAGALALAQIGAAARALPAHVLALLGALSLLRLFGQKNGRRRGAHVTLCQHRGDIPVCSAGLAETNRRTRTTSQNTDFEHRTFLPEHKPRAGRFE